MGGKDRTSSEARQKQLGKALFEANTSGAPTSKAADKGTLVELKPVAEEGNQRGSNSIYV
jgi:hypothetical protein